MISLVPETPIGPPAQAEPRQADAGLFAALLGGELQAETAPEGPDPVDAAALAEPAPVVELEKPPASAAPPLAAALMPAMSPVLAQVAAPEPAPSIARAGTAPLPESATRFARDAVIDSQAAIADADVGSARLGDARLQPRVAISPPVPIQPGAVVANATPDAQEPDPGLGASGAAVVERIGGLGGVDPSISSERGPRAPAMPTEPASGSADAGRTTIASTASGQFEHGERSGHQGPGTNDSAAFATPGDAVRNEETNSVPTFDARLSTPAPVSETAPTPVIGAGVPVASTPVAPLQQQPTLGGAAPVRADELSAQVHHLADAGGGTARLRLSPAHLGEIELEVTVRGDSVAVRIVAHEQAARSAVEDGRASLIDGLSSRSLRMESLDVSGAPLSDRNQGQAAFGERDLSSQQDRSPGDREPGEDTTRRQDNYERSQASEISQGISRPQRSGMPGGVDLRV